MDHNLCPECGEKMVRRQNKKDLSWFWGCSQFPACKGTRNSEGEARQPRDDDDQGMRLPSSLKPSRGSSRRYE